eukprot:augustus_masked-scaffold_5-processed-gene-17.8-mRNA-1 protein AED:1.00 eAED:1.00 QI:0/-1/0/0/-1/1/1/0/462
MLWVLQNIETSKLCKKKPQINKELQLKHSAVQMERTMSNTEVSNLRYKSTGATSFDVFMRFVDVQGANQQQEVTGERIFSRECFDAWVSSRTNPPKRPQESFRKAITAHLRGRDRRKPFPEAVEKSLLKIIRVRKVWPAFQGTKHLVGINGFQGLGYWENIRAGSTRVKLLRKKRTREQTLPALPALPDIEKVQKKAGTKLIKQPLFQSANDILYINSKICLYNVAAFGDNKFTRVPERLLSNEGIGFHKHIFDEGPLCLTPTSNSRLTDASQSEAYLKFFDIIENKCSPAIAASAFRLAQTLLGTLSTEKVAIFLEAFYEQCGFFYANMQIPKNYVPLPKGFHFPLREDCCFSPWKKTGSLIGEYVTETFIYSDHVANEIFRGNVCGVHRLALSAHKLELDNYATLMVGEKKSGDETWSRSINFRADGTLVVLLSKNTILSEQLWLSEFQDITMEYKHLLY